MTDITSPTTHTQRMNFADRKESSKANNTLALSNYLFLEHNTNILKSQLSKHQNSKQKIKTIKIKHNNHLLLLFVKFLSCMGFHVSFRMPSLYAGIILFCTCIRSLLNGFLYDCSNSQLVYKNNHILCICKISLLY